MTDRSTAERINMSTSAIMSSQRFDAAICICNSEKVDATERRASFSDVLKGEQKNCPYSSMAEDGVIEYNGVTFVCDYESNSICLGDVSKPNEVLNISLPSGGHLKVNVNNLGDLSNASGMFSPADLAAIMRAIAQYNHCTRKVKEAEDEEVETVEDNVDEASKGNVENVEEAGENQEVENDSQIIWQKVSFSSALRTFEESHKLSAQGLKEEKDWRDMSGEEWDKMLEDVDNYIDAFKEQMREMKEKQDEAAQKAALEADSDMKTIASSSAALAVANGFDSGTSVKDSESEDGAVEDGAAHEKNWTKNLKTDDQTILMTAKEAQKMERNAASRLQEIQLDDVTAMKASADYVISKYMRNMDDYDMNSI